MASPTAAARSRRAGSRMKFAFGSMQDRLAKRIKKPILMVRKIRKKPKPNIDMKEEGNANDDTDKPKDDDQV